MRLILVVVALSILPTLEVAAQVVSIGMKQNKSTMFQASVNLPLLANASSSNESHDYFVGLDYTTKNKHMPSGLQPQFTYAYYLIDDDKKAHILSTNLGAGYLIDFRSKSEFQNQFTINPHIYYEYFALLNVRVGYEHMFPFQKGYPYVSVGLGGFVNLFRNFKIM